MKSSFLVLVLFTVYASGSRDNVMEMMQKCKTKTGATDADIAKVMIHDPPENQEQKCMFSCIMEGISLVSLISSNFPKNTNDPQSISDQRRKVDGIGIQRKNKSNNRR